MSKEAIHILLKSFSQRPVAYQKIYAQITGRVTAGLLLSQIVYWWFAVGERDFHKTDKQFREELAMGPREFKTAKTLLKKLKVVVITIRGIPAITYYRLDETELTHQISSWAETHQLVKTKCANPIDRNVSTNSKTNFKDHSENIKKQKEEVYPENIIESDLRIVEQNKFFMQKIQEILRPSRKEAKTFANIAKYLVDGCQQGKLDLSVFKDAVEWAKQAKISNVANKKGLFVAKVKQEMGFKAQRKLLIG
jgi:hypothetical protein